jgi:hypothetical protein
VVHTRPLMSARMIPSLLIIRTWFAREQPSMRAAPLTVRTVRNWWRNARPAGAQLIRGFAGTCIASSAVRTVRQSKRPPRARATARSHSTLLSTDNTRGLTCRPPSTARPTAKVLRSPAVRSRFRSRGRSRVALPMPACGSRGHATDEAPCGRASRGRNHVTVSPVGGAAGRRHATPVASASPETAQVPAITDPGDEQARQPGLAGPHRKKTRTPELRDPVRRRPPPACGATSAGRRR